MEQLELRGISLQYSASATKPEGVETVDMSGMTSLTLGAEAYNNNCSSGPFTVYGGKPVGFSYRIQKGHSFVIGIIQHSTLNIQHCYKALAHELTPSAVRAAISACTMAFTI